MNRGSKLYLKVEDTCVAMLEALSRGYHTGQESGVQSEGGSSRKKPAVTWEERLGLREGERRHKGESLRGVWGGGWWRGMGQGGQGGAAAGSCCDLQDLGAQHGFRGLTQSPLTHICSTHVLTDELGLSAKLLRVMRNSRPQPGSGRKKPGGEMPGSPPALTALE